MMPNNKLSAGILLYRQRKSATEFFLVHPGGPFWARKDEGAWSIPKGEYAEGEDPLKAARREFMEETGSEVNGDFGALTPVKQKSGKIVHAFYVEGDLDERNLVSNLFEMEWPPRSGKKASFPEVDRGGWFTLGEAKKKILPGQLPILMELSGILKDK
jgi:predicted NUDIX family NTP pyrophosphohydrolase